MKLDDNFEGEISYIFYDGINRKALFIGNVDIMIRDKKMIIYDENRNYLYRCEYCDETELYCITEEWDENNYWYKKTSKKYSEKIKVIRINNYDYNSFGNYGKIDFSIYNDE